MGLHFVNLSRKSGSAVILLFCINYFTQEIIVNIKDKDNLQKYISDFDLHKQKAIICKTAKLELTNNFIRAILAKVILHKEKVEIILCKNQLIKGLEYIVTNTSLQDETKLEPEEPIKITKSVRLATTSRNGSVLIVNNAESKEVNMNPLLIKIIAKSYYWNKLIEEGKAKDNRDIQKFEKLSDNNYIKRALTLRILSPRIVEAILNGKQPADLTVQKLLQVKTLSWQEQEKQLNFI